VLLSTRKIDAWTSVLSQCTEAGLRVIKNKNLLKKNKYSGFLSAYSIFHRDFFSLALAFFYSLIKSSSSLHF
jgi:hypothetical protein